MKYISISTTKLIITIINADQIFPSISNNYNKNRYFKISKNYKLQCIQRYIKYKNYYLSINQICSENYSFSKLVSDNVNKYMHSQKYLFDRLIWDM